jgi:cob(I)alamin adenosyltransferase
MRLYTKTGDTGETGLFGGQRVRKDNLRVDAYGTVDEANAVLGICVTQAEAELRAALLRVQSELFTVGADLATPLPRDVGRVTEALTARLEKEIDATDAVLSPLRNFILPGGTPLAAHLHHARTVVRRAERLAVALRSAEPDATNSEVVRYLNRLSDWLFAYARLANHHAGVDDVPWIERA